MLCRTLLVEAAFGAEKKMSAAVEMARKTIKTIVVALEQFTFVQSISNAFSENGWEQQQH